MLAEIRKELIMDFAQALIEPACIIDAVLEQETQDEVLGDVTIWLLESDCGDFYWVLEGEQPLCIFKKSGIYQNAQRVIDGFYMMQDEEVETVDRMQCL